MNVRKLTVKGAAEAFRKGKFTPVELTEECISNIKKYSDLNFMICTNPHALDDAYESAERIRKGSEIRRLEGIPILVKDNIATGRDMPTTAGAGIMKGVSAKGYAAAAELLRREGAVIIGKTNMTEWAHFTSSDMPFGYSYIGGQTYNYYGRDLEVCGSSTGSCVGTAAGAGIAAIGTETSGSIVKPSLASGLIGFKPSKGKISESGVIPISFSQDTVGPIAKNMEDIILMADILSEGRIAYKESELKRAGVLVEFCEDCDEEQKECFHDLIKYMDTHGVETVTLNNYEPYLSLKDKTLDEDVLTYEFGEALEGYLKEWAEEPPIHDLKELCARNNENKKLIPYGQDVLEEALEAYENGGTSSEIYKKARERDLRITGKSGIDEVMDSNVLDVLILPHYYGYTVPARAGAPSIALPVKRTEKGFAGITLFCRKGDDGKLLSYAKKMTGMIRKFMNERK